MALPLVDLIRLKVAILNRTDHFSMSMNSLIWNAQGFVNPATSGTLKNWIKEHQLAFVAILEPQNSCDPSSLDHEFGLSFKLANSSNKI